MCIILTCDANRRPTEDVLRTCWTANPDGAGFAYATGEAVEISKGYMTYEDFHTALVTVSEGAPLIIHFRIGTSGGYGPEVTHPYPITRDLCALHALDVTCPVAIAHNGILPYDSDDARGISDTVAYVQRVVSRLSRQRVVREHGGLCASKKARRALRRTSQGSRLALIDAAGHILRIGDGWEIVEPGIYASNASWRRYKASYPSLYDVCAADYYDWDSGYYNLPTYCYGCDAYEICREEGPLCEGY